MLVAGSSRCADRSALSKALTEAIRDVYAAMEDLDAQRHKPSEPELIDALRAKLQACREEELRAQLAFQEHVEAHHCLAEEPAPRARRVGAVISRQTFY